MMAVTGAYRNWRHMWLLQLHILSLQDWRTFCNSKFRCLPFLCKTEVIPANMCVYSYKCALTLSSQTPQWQTFQLQLLNRGTTTTADRRQTRYYSVVLWVVVATTYIRELELQTFFAADFMFPDANTHLQLRTCLLQQSLYSCLHAYCSNDFTATYIRIAAVTLQLCTCVLQQ